MRGDREYIMEILTYQLGWWREGGPGSPYVKQRYICHRSIFLRQRGFDIRGTGYPRAPGRGKGCHGSW